MSTSMEQRNLLWVLLVACIGFAVSHEVIWSRPRVRVEQEMRVALPPTVQLVVAGGDRYLAANIAIFRAVTVGVFQLQPDTYRALAEVQVSAAVLNPRHEDNYYTAAAILPWNGQYDAAQDVLQRATDARKNDALPPFFHGFDRFQFKQDFSGAASDMMVAAQRSDPGNRAALNAIAAKWLERGEDPQFALRVVRSMAESSRNKDLKRLLEARVVRLEGLIALRDAATRYQDQHGHPPPTLDALVKDRLIKSIPVDPFGLGYQLDPRGKPMLTEKKQG